MSSSATPSRPAPLDNHPKYEKVKDLNSGTFGFVQLCKDKTTNELVAIKFIERGDKVTKYVEREIVNHRTLMHPHIVQFKEVFLTPVYLAIAMEFAPGGDMFEYVVKKNGLREDEARWFFQQLIVALDYCHKMGVVNRDIKLENTLLDHSPRPLVKICDFGYSKHEKFQSAPGSRVGTPAYLAPEVILTTKGKTYDGKTADVWSCGVMLYVMLVGAYPFERPEDKQDVHKLQKMIQRILHVDYAVPSHIKLSDDCKHLLRSILVADPAKRITIGQIYRHPWYTKNLPPGVVEMNNRPQPAPEGMQTVNQVKEIIEEARKAHGISMGAQVETDEYIDDAMESYDESSLDYN
uniref:Protein kinase domain-containing protein n=1 Tax=Dunaliella tertiolecta TaxID=3047 RepID=A0A7S3QM01_DUNTE|mmetsp:Transcript_7136/g.19184  ORF Transcript_7136/g.19184 Transcript_7136/m.19184 type:complete len:350 (+) Transcript_7136:35-1084(+)|eukprot:CAMPEP_0202365440 /NCGR_PEP_ID=MMETSP1126-20121109/16444_1 /ASSEMBLY_ACC=CAM_ASM_000457 /TAXON_ID=3047 /ORGANISM="Dunaliella tertiolecta, Strain CCMP1320" /LENGTH=349 /DNA_ID=CAMNT_0048960277 /DNA_START=38 /DNA_END=1087 /DNA_ORIENTATION=+